jgi:hypothetical protein
MTSSTTIARAASNGTATSTDATQKREHGVAVLRDKEARALISIACDALSQTCHVGHDMHGFLYGEDAVSDAQLHRTLEEALICLQTAEHYLRMLGSVLEERASHGPDPWAGTAEVRLI